jgi:hypothetical protein
MHENPGHQTHIIMCIMGLETHTHTHTHTTCWIKWTERVAEVVLTSHQHSRLHAGAVPSTNLTSCLPAFTSHFHQSAQAQLHASWSDKQKIRQAGRQAGSPAVRASNSQPASHSGMIHVTWKRPSCRWKTKRTDLPSMHHQPRLHLSVPACLPAGLLHLSNRTATHARFLAPPNILFPCLPETPAPHANNNKGV